MKQERMVRLIVKQDFLDVKKNENIPQGRIIEEPESRAKAILLAGFADIVLIPKLIQ